MTATANSMYPPETEAKELIAELCKLFYDQVCVHDTILVVSYSAPTETDGIQLCLVQGWVSGTGGGISVRCGADRIAMAPSGVQKERMMPEDMFVLDLKGNELVQPQARPPPYKPPKLSECSPLFMLVRPNSVFSVHIPLAALHWVSLLPRILTYTVPVGVRTT